MLRTAVLIAALWALAPPPPAAAQEGSSCEAAVVPSGEGEIAPGQTVHIARLSERIGRIQEVEVDPRSQAAVTGVTQSEADPRVVGFTLDHTGAQPGHWWVLFTGADGRCTGVVEIGLS